MKIILYGLLCFGIWATGTTYWYLCKIENLCPTETSNRTTSTNIETPLDKKLNAVENSDENSLENTANDPTIIPEKTEEVEIKTIETKEENLTIDFDKTLVYYFDFNNKNLRENLNSKPDFVLMIEHIKTNPNVNVQITGHTDNVGRDESNYALGLQRAEQTAEILQANGIAKERIQIFSVGEKKPLKSNDTDEGRAKNRRIEIDIIK